MTPLFDARSRRFRGHGVCVTTVAAHTHPQDGLYNALACTMAWAVPCPGLCHALGLCNALACTMAWAVQCPGLCNALCTPPRPSRLNQWDPGLRFCRQKSKSSKCTQKGIPDELQKVCPTRGPVTGQAPPQPKLGQQKHGEHEWVTGPPGPPGRCSGVGHRPYSDNSSAESEAEGWVTGPLPGDNPQPADHPRARETHPPS